MSFRTHFSEGIRILHHSLKKKLAGHKRHKGDANQICRQIVDECWNGKFFMTSIGHYPQFYTRDFGFCAEPLCSQGHREKAVKTLEYALRQFRKHGKITVAITPSGKPFDFPNYAIDSVPFFVHALGQSKAEELVDEYRPFLNKEIARLYSIGIDKETGLVKNANFSSMKDHSKRKGSCYDNAMIGMLSADAKKLNLENPFKEFNYEKLLKDNYWNGSFFEDDLKRKGYVAGDANIFPYWCNVSKSKSMKKNSIEAIKSEGLDMPFALKYSSAIEQKMIAYEFFVSGWQTDAIWSQLGLIYTSLLEGEARQIQMQRYKRLIERYASFMEVYDKTGKPFETFFYHSDAGMLWATLFIELSR